MSSLIESDLWDEPTLFAEDSPAKTFPSQESEQVSQEKELASSGTHSLSRRMSKRNGSSWRMSPDCLRQIRDAISEQSSLHWPTQGFLTLNGECWIRSSSESPNVAVESSLSQVLLTQVDDRYLLSPKAASGILRRTEKRGKPLPEALRQALLSVLTQQEEPETSVSGKSSLQPSESEAESGFLAPQALSLDSATHKDLTLSQANQFSPPSVAEGEGQAVVDFRHSTISNDVAPTLQAKNTGGYSLNYLPGVLEVPRGDL